MVALLRSIHHRARSIAGAAAFAMSMALITALITAMLPSVSTAAEPSADARTDTSLYQALGGAAGVHALTDDFVQRLTTDPRIAAQFKETNLKRLRQKLEEQFCQVSGGGCNYSGDPMLEVHKGLHISAADFNALVEDLQLAMDAQGIPFQRQNAFLALLAPMHRDIIASHIKP